MLEMLNPSLEALAPQVSPSLQPFQNARLGVQGQKGPGVGFSKPYDYNPETLSPYSPRP